MLLGSWLAALRGFALVCRPASQSSTFSGTPTFTKVSITQIRAGLDGSNFVGPRFFGPSSASSSRSNGRSSSSPALCCVDGGSSKSSSGSSLSKLILTSSIGVKLTRSSVLLSVTGCCRLPWMPFTSKASSSCMAKMSSVGKCSIRAARIRNARTRREGARLRIKCFAPSSLAQSKASPVNSRSPG